MKHVLNQLCVVCVSMMAASPCSFASEEPVNAQVAHLFYSNDYESDRTACTFQPAPHSPFDFEVSCPSGNDMRKFDLHVAVTHYDDTTAHPRAFVEILYWVQDFGTNIQPHKPVQYGTTLRLTSTAFHGLQTLDVSQDLGSTQQLHFELRVPTAPADAFPISKF